jgi:AAA domain
MDSFVVNIIGGPGVGKSTIYSLVYAWLKIRGHSAEQVQERAKALVWAKQFEVLDNQYYVSGLQNSDLAAVYGKVRFVVTDGSLIHGIYYNRHNPTNVSNIALTEKKILEMYNSYNNINVLLTRGDFDYEQCGRIQSHDEALNVDAELVKILEKHNINYVKFRSDHQYVDQIIDHILSEAGANDTK